MAQQPRPLDNDSLFRDLVLQAVILPGGPADKRAGQKSGTRMVSLNESPQLSCTDDLAFALKILSAQAKNCSGSLSLLLKLSSHAVAVARRN